MNKGHGQGHPRRGGGHQEELPARQRQRRHRRVGTVSSGDEKIGTLIAEAMEKVGSDGVITVEESKTAETYSEVVEGMQVDRGFLSPYMVTDTEKMEAVLDDPLVLLTDKKISNIQEIIPVLEQVIQAGKKLLIMAEDVEGEALSTLAGQQAPRHPQRAVREGPRLRRPPQGDAPGHRHILTGATVISSDYGLELHDTTIEQLGSARQVKAGKETTIIVDGGGDSAAIKERTQMIRNEYERSTSEYDREKLQERLARLAGGVAIIRVGAATETEMKEKKLRIEDALNATRAAVEEGIVAGGGTAYVNAITEVEKLIDQVEGDEKTGVQIIARALTAPLRQIATNAGLDASVILEKVKSSEKVAMASTPTRRSTAT